MMQQEASNETLKKCKSARASSAQLSRMLDFFKLNEGLAEGRFQVMNGKNESRKKWMELATYLNTMNGTSKSSEQWQVVWRDDKSDITKGKNFTQGLNGNKQQTDHDTQFNGVRVVVIGIIRSDYVEGSQECADSILEEEDLQNKLERGETALLKLKPRVPTICTEARSSKNSTRFSDDNESIEDGAVAGPEFLETDGSKKN